MSVNSKITALSITTTALFIALGLTLPILFHTTGVSGRLFLPMHIPVLLCGLICGPYMGALCGAVVPILSSLTGMPVLFPVGLSMSLELAVYGAVGGLCMRIFRRYPALEKIYPVLSLLVAMLIGRGVGGIASALFYALAGMEYSFQIFLSGAFITALPGIILQLLLIPSILYFLKRSGVLEKYLPRGKTQPKRSNALKSEEKL